MPAVVLAIANQKGGVGKTTTTVNLGSALSRQGVPTLIIDMDPQGNATSSLGLEKKPGKGVYEPLLSGADLSGRVLSTGRKNLWIVPSELDLAAAELELSSQENYLTKLRASLDRLKNEYGLQCILVDCPPTLGLLSMNSLCAADHLLVTLQSEYLALEGLGQIVGVIDQLKNAGANPGSVSWRNRNDYVRQPHPLILRSLAGSIHPLSGQGISYCNPKNHPFE
jgi:chromosome partitioning protein